MKARERVLKAVRREEPDRVPVTLAYEWIDDVCRQRGHPECVGRLKQDSITVGFRDIGTDNKTMFEPYLGHIPEGYTVNDLGVATGWSSTQLSHTFLHPLARMQSVTELEAYPFPDMTDPARHAHLEANIAKWHEQGIAVLGVGGRIFEDSWYMRGMERLLVDFYENREFAECFLDRMTDIAAARSRRVTEAGADILRLADDIACQKGMLMSPALWRQWLKPRLAKVIAAAREIRGDIPVFYHSDGDCEDVIPELIEVGVTILNPVQPECLDPARMKERYGKRLAFWGTIGVQSTMPFGTPETVKETVKDRIRTVAAAGGLVIAPTHTLERDVPWQNITALFEAVEEYGYY